MSIPDTLRDQANEPFGPGPSCIEIEPRPGVICEEWRRQDGKLHRLNGPARIRRHPHTGVVISEEWFKNGLRHRADGRSCRRLARLRHRCGVL
jgi:hypothetical protein